MSGEMWAVMDEIIDMVIDECGIQGISEYEAPPRLWREKDRWTKWKVIYKEEDPTPPDWEGVLVYKDISDEECEGFIAYGDDALRICRIAHEKIATKHRSKPFALTIPVFPVDKIPKGKSTLVWATLRDFLWAVLVSVGPEEFSDYCIFLLKELSNE